MAAYLHGDYLMLYPAMDANATVHLLSIRHHRQLSFDFAKLGPNGGDCPRRPKSEPPRRPNIEPGVEAFLTHLADDCSVAPSTHSQALSALLFFYTTVLRRDMPGLQEIGHPRRHRPLPVVLNVGEVRSVLARLQGEHLLLARLLYGTAIGSFAFLACTMYRPQGDGFDDG